MYRTTPRTLYTACTCSTSECVACGLWLGKCGWLVAGQPVGPALNSGHCGKIQSTSRQSLTTSYAKLPPPTCRLPPEVRRAAVAEMARVLKPGGICILTDSSQLGDREAYDATLG